MKSLLQLGMECVVSVIVAALMVILIASLCMNAMVLRHFEGLDMWFQNGRTPWQTSRHQGLGVWWVNITQSMSPLLGEVAEDTPPPDWARDLWGRSNEVGPIRLAALSAGFPLPAVGIAWQGRTASDFFPLPAELDISGNAIDAATRRFSEAPWSHVRVIPRGALVDGAPWFVLSLWSLRRSGKRKRPVNPPEAAEQSLAPES